MAKPILPASVLLLVLSLARPIFAADAAPAAPAPAAAPAPVAAPEASAPSDLSKQLADAQDQLATSLRSFSLLQDQNSDLKDKLDKLTLEKSGLAGQLENAQRAIGELKAAAAVGEQVDALRTQVRQAQDQIAVLAAENARLKLRLSLMGPPPSGGFSPTRPAQP